MGMQSGITLTQKVGPSQESSLDATPTKQATKVYACTYELVNTCVLAKWSNNPLAISVRNVSACACACYYDPRLVTKI